MRNCFPLLAVAIAVAAEPPVVVQNAKILTVTKGRVDGSLVIRDGKIADVGDKIMMPAGARVIDAAGQYVMPGIID